MNAWQTAWIIGVYLAVLSCVVAIVRTAIQANSWLEGVKQFLIFAAFVIAEWALESWANAKAPFYSYPQNIFPDMVPHLPFSSTIASDAVLAHACVQLPSPAVSASIPLAGGVIIYCLMWTGKQLLATNWFAPLHPIAIPFMVGVIALFLDLYLDPVLATSFACNGTTIQHAGLGFWQWFTSADLGDVWFNVPLYNYAVWYSAPALIAAFTVLVAGFVNSTTTYDIALRTLIFSAFAVILYTSPNAHDAKSQMIVVAIAIIGSVIFIASNWATYKRDNPFRFEFILPLLFIFLYPLLALLFAPGAPFSFPLLASALFFAALGIIFIFSPYVRWP